MHLVKWKKSINIDELMGNFSVERFQTDSSY